MQPFSATVLWQRAGQPFTDHRYSRAHAWHFDGGAQVAASSSPLSVALPMSDPAAVDPEEALVAAASSCHMLFFLALAAQRQLVVDAYADHALGTLDTLANGKKAMTRIVLRPAIEFAGRQPSAQELAQLHHEAHQRCYIANSLTTEIVIEQD